MPLTVHTSLRSGDTRLVVVACQVTWPEIVAGPSSVEVADGSDDGPSVGRVDAADADGAADPDDPAPPPSGVGVGVDPPDEPQAITPRRTARVMTTSRTRPSIDR